MCLAFWHRIGPLEGVKPERGEEVEATGLTFEATQSTQGSECRGLHFNIPHASVISPP